MIDNDGFHCIYSRTSYMVMKKKVMTFSNDFVKVVPTQTIVVPAIIIKLFVRNCMRSGNMMS